MFIKTAFGYTLKNTNIKVFSFGRMYYVQQGRYGKHFRLLDEAKAFALTLIDDPAPRMK
jgi:hypothetical protein